jgi:hypothetical protein
MFNAVVPWQCTGSMLSNLCQVLKRDVVDVKYRKCLYVVFCLFTVGRREREQIMMTWIKHDVLVGHQMLYKK